MPIQTLNIQKVIGTSHQNISLKFKTKTILSGSFLFITVTLRRKLKVKESQRSQRPKRHAKLVSQDSDSLYRVNATNVSRTVKFVFFRIHFPVSDVTHFIICQIVKNVYRFLNNKDLAWKVNTEIKRAFAQINVLNSRESFRSSCHLKQIKKQ